MLPRETEVSPNYPFFDELQTSLDAHFRALTDESVDVSSFNALKQGDKETALEFEMRLRQLAKRVNETNRAMIRTRFIEGLRDKAVRERAFIDGISLEEVVKMATRKEAIAIKDKSEYSPWNEDVRTATVAAVHKGAQSHQRGAQKFSKGRYGDTRQSGNMSGGYKAWKATAKGDSKRCKRCGVTEHRANYCPAENSVCYKCDTIGHFGRMCPTEVRNVSADETSAKEVENGIFD